MLPHGFLGTRADVLMDIVVIGIILTPVLMFLSFRLARNGRAELHQRIQTSLLFILLSVVVLFETDIRLSGGSAAFLSGSPYAGTVALRTLLISHILIAVLTFGFWAYLALISRRIGPSALRKTFLAYHRKIGKSVFVGATLTAISGTSLYYLGFVK